MQKRALLRALSAGLACAVVFGAAATASLAEPTTDPLGGKTPQQVLNEIDVKIPDLELDVGHKAPKLEVTSFLAGEAFSSWEPGKAYVVDFWATWCGPCIHSMPHLSEVQERFADRGLRVVAVNIWERKTGDERMELLREFSQTHAANMRYTVAVDGDKRMEETWMKAAGRRGIPSAFVVDRDGYIAWIGHPASPDMEATVERVLTTGMTDANRAELREKSRLERLSQAWVSELVKVAREGDEAKTVAVGEALLRTHLKDSSEALNQFAWMVVANDATGEGMVGLARRMATRACELTEWKNSDILDTLAFCCLRSDDQREAVRVMRLAVEHAKSDEEREFYADRLREMEEEIGETSQPGAR